MSLNLLDAVKDQVTSTVIDKISNFLGESRGNTSNAVTAAIPTILAFITEQSKSEKGAQNLIDLATDDTLGSLFKGSSFTDLFEQNRDSLMSKGNSMLIGLFGDKEAKLSKEISDYAGIGKEASDGILASIVPLIMSVLGGQISSQGLSASSLSGLFADQKDSIFSAIPSGLESVVGMLGLGALGKAAADTTTKVTSSVKDSFSDVKEAATKGVEEASSYASGDNDGGGGFMKWLLPLIGIVAALALLYFLMKQCEDKDAVVNETTTEEVIEVEEPVVDEVSTADIKGEYDPASNRFVYDLGDAKEIELADGTKLTVGSNSTEWKLYDFITNDSQQVSDDKTQGWFTMDRVYFETNSNNLDAESREQLDNIVAILKAYPEAQAKFGGYTDNSGSDDINIPLSDKRAKAVMADVVNSGIDASRLAAEGYGPQHPVCPANDTDACKAQNRRVDIRVTSK